MLKLKTQNTDRSSELLEVTRADFKFVTRPSHSAWGQIVASPGMRELDKRKFLKYLVISVFTSVLFFVGPLGWTGSLHTLPVIIGFSLIGSYSLATSMNVLGVEGYRSLLVFSKEDEGRGLISSDKARRLFVDSKWKKKALEALNAAEHLEKVSSPEIKKRLENVVSEFETETRDLLERNLLQETRDYEAKVLKKLNRSSSR